MVVPLPGVNARLLIIEYGGLVISGYANCLESGVTAVAVAVVRC
jgi:hypothetical protein